MPIDPAPPPRATREDLLRVVSLIAQRAQVKLARKNRAYAGSDGKSGENVFANLEGCENLSEGGISTETGIAIRMMDKTARLFQLVWSGAPEDDESLQDTIDDLLGYSALLLLRHLSGDPAKLRDLKSRLSQLQPGVPNGQAL